jgi:dihydrodipicolinate synthase/N-acetylneuraminate lyase
MDGSMSKLDFLQGAYYPLIVPFRNGKIDLDTYAQLIERQIVEGSHGLLVKCDKWRANHVNC